MSTVRRTARGRRPAWAAAAGTALASAALLGVTSFTGVASAAATPATACGSAHKSGVTVVVDFSKFHIAKPVKVGCDPTRPATGLAALKKVGFSYTFVPRVPGFVCRIDALPKKCNGAPASAYWSYWHAKPGGKWVYSAAGAASYHPKSGQVEGWAFGNGKPPSVKAP